MKRLVIIVGTALFFMLSFLGVASAESVDCDPFSIACGYTIQVGPFDIDVPIESIFPRQP